MKTFAGRKLGRPSKHRESLLKNLAASLLRHEKIRTTLPKAREVCRYAERIIAIAKSEEGLRAQRNVSKFIREEEVRKKLFEVLVPRFQSRNGGCTQIVKVGPRSGDAAPMAVVRLLP
jgi:ribosomal protein L17